MLIGLLCWFECHTLSVHVPKKNGPTLSVKLNVTSVKSNKYYFHNAKLRLGVMSISVVGSSN